MKRLFFIFGVVTCMIGVGFYLYQSDSATSKLAHDPIYHKSDSVKIPTETARKNTKATTSKKKECACCRSTLELEKVRQKRKELELWAREMINTHGYEEGMRWVAAKSPTLATRIQHLLKKEKNRPTPSLAVE